MSVCLSVQVHRGRLKEEYAINGTIRDVAVKVGTTYHPPPTCLRGFACPPIL